jgi:hypothetical protein
LTRSLRYTSSDLGAVRLVFLLRPPATRSIPCGGQDAALSLSLSIYIYPSVNISHPPRRRLRLALLSRPDTQVIQSLPRRHTMLSAVHGRHFAFFLENRLSTPLLLKAKTQPALQLGCSVSTQPQTSIQTTTWSKSKLDTYPGRARLTRRSEQSFIRTRHQTGWM